MRLVRIFGSAPPAGRQWVQSIWVLKGCELEPLLQQLRALLEPTTSHDCARNFQEAIIYHLELR
jgi:hypothetical protein